MSRVRYAAVVTLWIASLIIAGQLGLHAQNRAMASPVVLSGSDLGFRVEGQTSSGHPFGTFVVRMKNDGDWVPIEGTARANPATVK